MNDAQRTTPLTRRQQLHAFFEVPIRFAWLTLLVPSLAALKFAFGQFPNPHYPDYPAAWIMFFVPFAFMVIPIQLTYAHLPERLRPSDPLSW